MAIKHIYNERTEPLRVLAHQEVNLGSGETLGEAGLHPSQLWQIVLGKLADITLNRRDAGVQRRYDPAFR